MHSPANDNAEAFAPISKLLAEMSKTNEQMNQLADSAQAMTDELTKLMDALIARGRPDFSPME